MGTPFRRKFPSCESHFSGYDRASLNIAEEGGVCEGDEFDADYFGNDIPVVRDKLGETLFSDAQGAGDVFELLGKYAPPFLPWNDPVGKLRLSLRHPEPLRLVRFRPLQLREHRLGDSDGLVSRVGVGADNAEDPEHVSGSVKRKPPPRLLFRVVDGEGAEQRTTSAPIRRRSRPFLSSSRRRERYFAVVFASPFSIASAARLDHVEEVPPRTAGLYLP